jgi:hypothetical protein
MMRFLAGSRTLASQGSRAIKDRYGSSGDSAYGLVAIGIG